MSATLSLFIDVLVMTGLVATIYFVLKLSKSLDNFRSHRSEFEALMEELNKNIEHAYETLASLKETSMRSGGDIKQQIEEAKALSDELKIMNQSGNSLANRLEDLSSSAAAPSAAKEYSPYGDEGGAFEDDDLGGPSFNIQDRELDGPATDAGGKEFQSQAEKELFEALQRNKKKSA